MGLALRCYQECKQRTYLKQDQKLALKQLILVSKSLRHPKLPYAKKGLEGMIVADKILKKRKSSGILIGGLAETIWNQQRKEKDLYQNKDVDVAILDDNFKLAKPFEGGIDWWIPKSNRITLEYPTGNVQKQEKWYENGNGIVLSFGLDKEIELAPGLYLPDSEWVVDMREYEADANIDYKELNVEFDEDVFQKFRKEIRKKVKTRLPKFLREKFQGQILSEYYEDNYATALSIDLERFDIETIRGINKCQQDN